ncbi:MAG TPA: hypothetical protein VHX37_13350 [Acidobacteriaceae bacterium]|jgi:hypothetical protein|nr:hypothetical protein [Acidobacteriaceae bacterium]
MKLWCVPCARANRATVATCTVEDDLCCAACAAREAAAAGVEPVPLKNADSPALPVIPEIRRAGDQIDSAEQEAVDLVTHHGAFPKGATLAPVDAKDRRAPSAGSSMVRKGSDSTRELPAGADDREKSFKEEPPSMRHSNRLSPAAKELIRNADPSISHNQLADKYGVTAAAISYHRSRGRKSSKKAGKTVPELPPPGFRCANDRARAHHVRAPHPGDMREGLGRPFTCAENGRAALTAGRN